jgi:transposase
LYKIFNYILRVLYLGCQWKMLPIQRNAKGRPEIHYTRIDRLMRRWQADGGTAPAKTGHEVTLKF